MRRIMALLLMLPSAAMAALTVPAQPHTGTAAATNTPIALPVVWHDSLKTAMAVATLEYQPVLLILTGANCAWCTRLKADMAGDAEIQSLLRHFTAVELEVEKNEGIAAQYGIRGIPAILVLSSDGSIRTGVNGYVPPSELRNILKNALNPELLKKRDKDYNAMIALLRGDALPPDQWPDVLRFYGDPEKRKEVHDAIFNLSSFPATNIVPLLQDRRLAVRLGAMDILEEMSGDTFGYEPWLDQTNFAGNVEALARWETWVGSRNDSTGVIYSALNADQIAGYLQDMLSENTERSVRAMRMLRHSGPGTGDAIARFLANHADLPVGTVRRIKEILYSTTLPSVGGVDSVIVAHRLVYGTVDVRQKTIASLSMIGKAALPPLRDSLTDPDALIREAAVDAMVAAGKRAAVPFLQAQLGKEKDVEVVYAILRGLGQIRSKQGLGILTTYLSNSNEDIVICAINSIAKLKAKSASGDIAKCLDDPRWRVRIAALDAVGKLRISSLSDKLIKMLDDKDEFVRYSTIAAMGKISAKKAAKKLEAVFLSDDSLKGPIAAAFISLDIPFPNSFRQALEGKQPETILAVLDSFRSHDQENVKFAIPYVKHENSDVACSAIRIVAVSGLKNAAARAAIVETLNNGRREAVLAALESIVIAPEPLALYMASHHVFAGAGSATPAESANSATNIVDSIMDAFGEESPAMESPAQPAAAPVPAAPAAPVSSAADDILSAFEEAAGATPAPDQAGTQVDPVAAQSATVEALMQAIESKTAEGNDPDLRFKGAVLLAKCGNPTALPFLQNGLADRPVDERTAVAMALGAVRNTNTVPILRRLLQDQSDSVREATIGSILSRKPGASSLDLIFNELRRDGTRLKPHEIYRYELTGAIRENHGAKRAAGRWARQTLKESSDTAMLNLALVLLETVWIAGDEAWVEKHFESTDPLVRRAAYHALGRNKPDLFKARIESVHKDPSEYVRAVLPNIYMKGTSTRWVHFFDKEHFDTDSHYWSSRNTTIKLPDEARQALLTLANDASGKIKIEACFCLLSHRQPIDLAAFVNTIELFADRQEISARVAEYVLANYRKLGNNFSVLLPFLMESREESDSVQQVLKHFNLDTETWQDSINLVQRDGAPADMRATFLEDATTNAPLQQRSLKIVYFTSSGCDECARIERMLPDMRDSFPWLQVETHDIRKTKAMRINEALSERFGVPEAQRLVTPAIFSAAGFLIRKDITFDRLGELLAQSTAVPSIEWTDVPEEALAAADARIDTRFDALSLIPVLQAGLLDGVNPCAFATIIFLISYLQVARRRPVEIAQIAAAFIAGVFAAYFALGLGLAEIIARISVFKRAGIALNWAMAAATLVFMILNIRDGVLCLQGRLNETALQLPGVLKDQIHSVIRRSARHARFVVAALVMGVLVSVLELACTGQVYLPTIGYMLQKRGPTFGIVGMLLAYNTAFVLPLVAIFVLTCFGLTAQRLTTLLQRHAAVVKFGTAVLFLALFVIFILGGKLG